MKKKLMLIDGNSILNRAFYGLSGRQMLSTRDGLHTNAIFGFLNIIDKYINEEEPDYISVAFDLKDKTFRHEQYDRYKANRKGMPEELAEQMPVMKKVLDAMNIKRFEISGYEADDIIGTLAKDAEKEGIDVTIVTGDRDALQLVSSNIKVKLPTTSNGRPVTNDYDKEAVISKYGLSPEKLIEVKGLMGDSSDNIPGVKGVGEKTALKLIIEYGNIENVYEHIDEISGKSLKEKLIQDKEMAFISRKLGTVKTDIENLTDSMESLQKKGYNKEELLNIFMELEFNSFIKKYNLRDTENEKNMDDGKNIPDNTEMLMIDDEAGIEGILKDIESQNEIIIYPYLKSGNMSVGHLMMMSILAGVKLYNIDFTRINGSDIIKKFKSILESENIKKYMYDGKSFVLYLKKKEIEMKAYKMDIAVADYVINVLEKHDLESIAYRYLDLELESIEDVLGKGKKAEEFNVIDFERRNDFINKRILCISAIKSIMEKEISDNGFENVFYNIEMPLIEVLAEMEYNGFKVNRDELIVYSKRLNEKIIDLSEEIFEIAGEQFNINSPKQLGVILFEKLGLPSVKKTKTGYSTDVEVLEQLYFKHEIIEKIMKYRQYTKLSSTYADGLMKVINPETGKIHTSFSQITAVTGRLSSIEPNLQNIPIKLEMGREIRKVFITENDDYILTAADYSQIELRILAEITKDKNLMEAFNNNVDIHTNTAMKIFDLPEIMITNELRIKAKAVNFSIIYGIGEFSLSKDINVTVKEAKRIIEEYLNSYPGIRKYMDETIEKAKEKGYVLTIFGRRRAIPELKSKNHNVREFGKRAAMNSPIQGSAADVIKIAMINVYKELRKRKLKSRLILQVHDELIIETHKDEKDIIEELLRDCMENAIDMNVKLKVHISTGTNWYETK